MKRLLVSALMVALIAEACTTDSTPAPLPSPQSQHPPTGTSTSVPSEPPVPVIARVTCTSEGASVEMPSVRPLSDGVRFLGRNASSTPINFVAGTFNEAAVGEHGALSDGRTLVFSPFFGSPGKSYDNTVIRGTAELQLWGVPPGSAAVACVPPGSTIRKLSSTANLDVADSAGIYIPVRLSCDDTQAYEMFFGGGGEVVEWFRDHMEGLRDGDLIGFGEYPQQRTPVLTVTREGVTVAVARLHRGFRGILATCHGSDLRPTGGFAPP